MKLPGEQFPEILHNRLVYQGRKFKFDVNTYRLPNGAIAEMECIRHPGGALAVPVTAAGKLVLVRQYRFAIAGQILEFPAGTVEMGETPLATVKREIQEETGYRAHRWQELGAFPLAPGYCDEFIYAFLAQELELLPAPPQQDEDEDIERVEMTPQELETSLKSGMPFDAKTICSFYLAQPFLP